MTFEGTRWVMDLEPHAAMWAKRMFPKVSPTAGKLELSHSPAVCRDIEWFISRFPLECSDMRSLQDGAAAHVDRIASLNQIIDPNYQPRRFRLALPARDYQSRAAELWLRSNSLLVADDVGLGKTCTSLAGLTDPRTLPACIVCLAHLPHQWNREIDKFAPALSSHVIQRRENYELPRFSGKTPDVLLISYNKLEAWSGVLGAYCKSIIFDEVQELRHRGTDKYSAALHIAQRCDYRLGLSATPIYNYGGEIWSIMNILAPGALGSIEEFWQEWCTGYEDGEQGSRKGRKAKVTDPVALGSWLREQHLMIRRTRKEVGRELPELSRITHEIECDEGKLKEIENRAGELARLILSEVTLGRGEKMHAHEEFNALMRQYTGIAKAPYVAEFVRLLVENGEPVVLFAWHRAVYDILLEKLKDFRPVLYTGSESASAKQEAVTKFCDGGTDLIIVSLRSGAGLDGLQHRCSTVVFGELDWSPGVHEQCIGRVFRDGQPNPVAAYFLLSDSGIDPFIAETLGLKSDQIDGLRGDVGDELKSVDSTESLRKLAETYLKRRGAT